MNIVKIYKEPLGKVLPTPDMPLELTWVNTVDSTRSIPSLKNRRTPIVDKKGRMRFIINAGVQRFIRSMERNLVEQWERSEFGTIQLPLRVVLYAVVAKYVTDEDVVPVSDLDNQYTTVQEMLQNGLIIEDDKQIKAFFCEEKLVFNRKNQYAKCWLWVDTETPVFEQYKTFFKHHKKAEAAEIPSMLSLMMGDD